MYEQIKKYLEYHFHHPNYFYFLVSLIILIIVPPYATIFHWGELILDITYGTVVMLAIFYTTPNYKEFIFHGVLGTLLFGLFLFQPTVPPYTYIIPFLMVLFFSLAFGNIIRYIFRVKQIGLNEIFASIAGYLVLGIITTPFFFLLEQFLPHSFNLPENAQFYDFLYFSYITMTTVGYGDIAPVNHIAKSMTILVGILGQLYLTILIAIIIGKYLAYEIMEDQED